MAIKINNTIVIDDGRGISGTGLTVTSISAGGSVGSAGSVLTSTGSAIYWGSNSVGLGQTLNTQTFNASGTWIKPGSGTWVVVRCWGGGGGGGRGNNATAGGGGGGAFVEKSFLIVDLPGPVTVTIGAGGTVSTTAGQPGFAGGTTTFGPFVSSYGGGGGGGSVLASNDQGGGGGGGGSAGTTAPPDAAPGAGTDLPSASKSVKGWSIVNKSLQSNIGVSSEMVALKDFFVVASAAGSGWSTPNTSYGGGGGGSPADSGGTAVWGGGGGGGWSAPFGPVAGSPQPGGTSTYGGRGGNGVPTPLGVNPAPTSAQPPGGGGGASFASTVTAGPGSAGRCIVYVY